MYQSLSPLIWVIINLIILSLLGNWIHKRLLRISYRLTRNPQWSIILVALIFLPGVFLHESSHWITANLVGMRTGGFSLWPSFQPDGTIELGHVKYYKTGLSPVRESLIGGAPLIFGIGAILLIGRYVFEVDALSQVVITGTPQAINFALEAILSTADAWIWIYLLFAISNSMMPSPSDRRAWPLFGAIVIALLMLMYFAGFREEMWQALIGPITDFSGYLLLAFGITIVVDMFFVALIWMIELIVTMVLG